MARRILAPLTDTMVAQARLLDPLPAVWAADPLLPTHLVAVSRRSTTYMVWMQDVHALPDCLPGQLAAAVLRSQPATLGLPYMVVDPAADAMFLRARVLEVVDKQPWCPWCGMRPCLDTCFVVKLLRGEWGLTMGVDKG